MQRLVFLLVANFGINLLLSNVIAASENAEINARALAATYMGIEAGAAGDLEQAQLHFERALHHMPYFIRAMLYLEICDDVRARHIAQRDAVKIFRYLNFPLAATTVSASELIREVQHKHPNYAPAWLVSFQTNQSQRNAQAALADLERALEVDPDKILPNYFRAQLRVEAGAHPAALTDFERVLELDPSFAPAYLERGKLYLVLGKFQLAVDDCDNALAAWPKWGRQFKVFAAYLNLGIEKVSSGDFGQAVKLLDRAAALNPRFGEPYLYRGIAHRNLNAIDSALADLERAMTLGVTSPEVFYNRAMCLQTRKLYAAAMNDLRKAIALDSTHIEAHYRLAETLCRQKQYSEAVSAFDTVIKLDGTNYWAHYWRAVAQDHGKNYTEAVRSYRNFLLATSLSDDAKHVVFAKHRIRRLEGRRPDQT